MVDNGFVDGAYNASQQFLPVNPWADKENAIVMRGLKSHCCNYLASFGYNIAVGGATTTITPLTGNLSSKLRYYRVEITDGKNTAVGALDLGNRTAAFVINTSILDANAAWTIGFFGAESNGVGVADCYLPYKIQLCCRTALTGVIGDSIPSDWLNVQLRLKLTSTDDANFSLFPADGLVINQGDVIDLTAYKPTTGTLVQNGSYIFSVEIKKIGNEPTVPAAPFITTGNVIASWANAPYPFLILTNFTEVLSTLTLNTTAIGAFTDKMTFQLTNEGVTPSFDFTATSVVAV